MKTLIILQVVSFTYLLYFILHFELYNTILEMPFKTYFKYLHWSKKFTVYLSALTIVITLTIQQLC